MQRIEILEKLFNAIPYVFWKNKQGTYLGINGNQAKSFNLNSMSDFVGKTAFEILEDQESALQIHNNDVEVMTSEKIMIFEETIVRPSGTKTYLSQKQPLYDHDHNVIGLLGFAIDITEIKKQREELQEKLRTLEDIKKMTDILPAPIYWIDVNSVILGANEAVKEGIGVSHLNEYVGKSLHELYPKEMADHIKRHNEEVMRTGKKLIQEEPIIDKKGNLKYFTAAKAPLRDDNGNIIGIIGTSIDITAQKEAERLKQESQEKFTHLANQVAHDIRSPLASLLMIVKSCEHIPEADRIALREAATSINDIANHLLHQYEKREFGLEETEERQAMLVSMALLEVLTAKKYQYQKLPIKFSCQLNSNAQFAFIKIEPSAFKRMLSNLMNNSVDALGSDPGEIELQLIVDNEWVQLIIRDTGRGMSQEVIDTILAKKAITIGKKNGHGLGFGQIWETLEQNQGELTIDSTLNYGTTISLTFPRIKAPLWIAEEIVLQPNDLIIILDDDPSIHGAWRTRFDPILQKNPSLQLKHFQVAHEAIEFINQFDSSQKENIFLLTDYELLKQNINGLDVIAATKLTRSVLVTSHYADLSIHAQAATTATPILPKQLAAEIIIKVVSTDDPTITISNTATVDRVLVDNDSLFVNVLVEFVFSDEKVDIYYDPNNFLTQLHRYDKRTKIYLDNNYANTSIKGLDVAEKLHIEGFQRIYLLSGATFRAEEIPPYLTVIRKDDIAKLKSL